MIVKKINKIKNFGIFKDFHWTTSIPDFKKYNLLYGWNYSGKTTLSRIFRSFETQAEHPSYSGAEFELEDDSGTKHKQSNLATLPNVRVFNQDFIGKNLKWYSNDEHIEPIFLLGEQNVELQNQLDKKKEEIEKLKLAHTTLKQTYEMEEEAIKQAESNCARNIKQQLSQPDYEVRHLRPVLVSLGDATEQLSDEECASTLSVWRSPDKMDSVSLPSLPKADTIALLEEVKTVIAKVVTGQPIERLKSNPHLEEWAETGLTLHEHESECQFCGKGLTTERRGELAAHFSESYKLFQGELGTLRVALERNKSALNNLPTQLPDRARYYQELRTEYDSGKTALDAEKTIVITFLDWLIDQLDNKQSKTFEAVTLTPPSQVEFELQAKYDQIISTTEKHNQKTANFEQAKNAAKDKLIKHYASDFLVGQNYKAKQASIKIKKEEYVAQATQLKTLETEKGTMESELSDALKGATKVNDYIKLLFQHDGIKLEVTSENKFLLKRNGFPAENLSEGEKTAISFAYFITCLEDRNTNLGNTIVFVDDPISSLDSNHLFNIYAFIKSKLGGCGQLIVSTHNLEFFNLLKDWLKERENKDKSSLYLVRRLLKQNAFESIFESLPSELERFKSEYHYLFSILKKFDDQQNANFEQLFQIPNITRRFLEAYLGFRVPNESKPMKNLPILIDDETERNKVYKFVNEYSHNESTTRSLIFHEFSECSEVVKAVLKAVESKDQKHYEALCENC